MRALKKVARLTKAREKQSTARFGLNGMVLDVNKVEVGYNELVELDGTKCEFANMLFSCQQNYPTITFDPEETRKIAYLIRDIEEIMDFRQNILELMDKRSAQFASTMENHRKRLAKKSPLSKIFDFFWQSSAQNRDTADAISSAPQNQGSKKHSHEETRSCEAGLFVFVSHLGRAVCWQCDKTRTAEVRREKANEEFSKSKQHLYRATMDAYKLLLETILYDEDMTIKRQCGLLTPDFWQRIIEVRRLEHDRLEHTHEAFMVKSNAYRDIFYEPCTLFIERNKEKLNSAVSAESNATFLRGGTK